MRYWSLKEYLNNWHGCGKDTLLMTGINMIIYIVMCDVSGGIVKIWEIDMSSLSCCRSRDHGWGRRSGTRCHSVYLIKKINESDCGLFSETFERGKWLVEKWLQLAGRSHREMYTKLHSQRHTWSALWVHSPPLPPPTWPFAPRGAEVFIVDPSLIDKRPGVASSAIYPIA